MHDDERIKNPIRRKKDKPYSVEYLFPERDRLSHKEGWFAYGKYATFEEADTARRKKSLAKIDGVKSRILFNGEVVGDEITSGSSAVERSPL